MMKTITCNDPQQIKGLLARQTQGLVSVDEVVAEIIAQIRSKGDEAVLGYTKQFDGVQLDQMEVTKEEIACALTEVDADFFAVLKESAENIRCYHEKQKRSGYVMADKPGIVLGQRVIPMDRVGIYVPGGTASYPSTVLMDAIPAQIASVGEIIMVTPPDKNGHIHADILAAAHLAGVDRIFKVGGAQAVAALAYGTETIPQVDKIIGPGNIYVATAKRMVYGQVDIDMIAGPSEILIIADASANPKYLAMDLLAQAEHDRLAASFLVTTDPQLAKQVEDYLSVYLADLPRRDIAQAAICNNSAIILTDNLNTAVDISNCIAPEHLEICTDDPFALLPSVRHAGSIFLGHHTPEALGDYLAGPNHTLPTSGTARFSSGLSVDDFVKKSSFIYYDRGALRRVGRQIDLFATHEGLHAHARSVTIRLEEESQ